MQPRPFAGCALRSLPLLACFVLCSNEARAVRSGLLRLAGVEASRPCEALYDLVAIARSSPGGGWALDGALAPVLGPQSARFEAASVAELADLWWREGSDLRGTALAALVWQLARGPRPAVRPLERQIVRNLEPERLFCEADFDLLPGLFDLKWSQNLDRAMRVDSAQLRRSSARAQGAEREP